MRRRSYPAPCPADHGSEVVQTLGPAITELLVRRGINYVTGTGPAHNLLWCLGGPEFYRSPDEVSEDCLQSDSCLDLTLRVCDEHRVVSLELYPYDIVPEWGGTGPDDPFVSEPVPLDPERNVTTEVLERLERWLDEILVLPNPRESDSV